MLKSGSHSTRKEYDALAHVYDRRWAAYVAASNRATLQRCPPPPGARILDIACGTGELLVAIAGAYPRVLPTGVDLSAAMLHTAAAKPGTAGRLACADAHALPFAAGAFDRVYSVSALHYLPDPGLALREARRALKPGGRLVITDWCHDFRGCRIMAWLLPLLGRAHVKTYTAAECRQLLEGSGFAVETLDTYKITRFWGLMTAVAAAG